VYVHNPYTAHLSTILVDVKVSFTVRMCCSSRVRVTYCDNDVHVFLHSEYYLSSLTHDRDIQDMGVLYQKPSEFGACYGGTKLSRGTSPKVEVSVTHQFLSFKP
jgi:hypothetical protein